MSSFNIHKAQVLDSSLPISDRFSHLRSCLNKVANLEGCTRAALVERIFAETGINVERGGSESELLLIFQRLLIIRSELLG